MLIADRCRVIFTAYINNETLNGFYSALSVAEQSDWFYSTMSIADRCRVIPTAYVNNETL